ncbi:hypothetical protein AB9E28_36055, partial [Rhizobium leguminosarum]|uniref:hypothetical protein n=1 Tax=Rhizobium leguminosarum TaxID=384 RepID=UPI003F9E0C26
MLDGEIQSTFDIVYGQNPADYFRDITVNLRRGAFFRPLALSLEKGNEGVFAGLEERIWAAF